MEPGKRAEGLQTATGLGRGPEKHKVQAGREHAFALCVQAVCRQ